MYSRTQTVIYADMFNADLNSGTITTVIARIASRVFNIPRHSRRFQDLSVSLSLSSFFSFRLCCFVLVNYAFYAGGATNQGFAEHSRQVSRGAKIPRKGCPRSCGE